MYGIYNTNFELLPQKERAVRDEHNTYLKKKKYFNFISKRI